MTDEPTSFSRLRPTRSLPLPRPKRENHLKTRPQDWGSWLEDDVVVDDNGDGVDDMLMMMLMM